MPKRSYNRILDEHLHILIAQGNHEAYERLKRRYHCHSLALCRDILKQYCKTGVSVNDLTAVCDGCFMNTVKKYDSSKNSFFSFWKEMATQKVMEYLVNNSYGATPDNFKLSVSLDQEIQEKHPLMDIISEVDDDFLKRKKIFEIKSVIYRNEALFTGQETALLNFVLDGYSLAELEHTGVMKRSTLYLTFNSAIEKLQMIMKTMRRNKH